MESNNLELREKTEKKEVQSIGKYGNIKADYFLQKVFDNLEKKKTLEIVKNNKNIKKRINININDYKEYSEKYSSIEIEIKPVNNKSGNFINIKEEDKKYYHIYFNIISVCFFVKLLNTFCKIYLLLMFSNLSIEFT